MNQQDLFQGYPFPRSNTQEVLLTLIIQGHASLKDFGIMQGFRTRISEINNRHGIRLKVVKINTFNRFGNPLTYHLHRLPESEKQKAIEIYNKMVNKKLKY